MMFPTSAPAFGLSAFAAFSFSQRFVLPRFTISTAPHIQNRWIHTFSSPVVLCRRFMLALLLLLLVDNDPSSPNLVMYRRHKLRPNPRGRVSYTPEAPHASLGLE